MSREPIKVVCDIIQHELGLRSDQIIVFNQQFIIPKRNDLFIVANLIEDYEYGQLDKDYTASSGYDRETILPMRSRYIISVMSRNNEARLRHNEVKIAIRSQYSKSLQRREKVGITPIDKNFSNASAAEGPSMLTRFDLEIMLFYQFYSKKSIDYFDQFKINTIFDK